MMSDHNHVDDEFFDANQVVETSPFAAAARRRGGAEDEVMIENGRGKKDLSLDDSSFEYSYIPGLLAGDYCTYIFINRPTVKAKK